MKNVYERMIDVIQKKGWHQGDFYSPDGSVCIAAAFCETKQANPFHYGVFNDPEWENIMAVIDAADWNDDSSRTEEDVLTLLKFAAADELDTWKELYGDD